jgi:type I restriction enzyme, S subunit
MISDLKAYPAYKDSGIDWLNQLPMGWSARRAKCFLREADERSQTGKEVLLSVSHLTGVTPRSEKTVTMFLAKTNVGYKVCQPGDVVINTLWAWMAALGVARHAGIVSPAYAVYRPLPGSGLLPRFADHLLRTPLYAAEYLRRSKGVRHSRMRLYPEQFLRIPIVCPPIPDQTAIVRFLDWANGRLDRAVRAKRRVIALLDEQKRAITHRAVTRGLDASAPLKASGIPWLGDIPDHWDVMRTKFLARIKTGGRDTVDRVDGGPYPFFVRSQTVERIDTYSFDGEAVLTAGDGAGVAKVFHYVNGKFDYHQRVYKFSDFKRVDGRFFFLYLQSTLRFEALDASAKSTVDSLRLPLLQNFPTLIPSAEEQCNIVRAVQAETSGLDTAISRLQREVDLLREYRTRLVTDAVTGQIDVRTAASQITDEAMLDATEDETDSSVDSQIADEEMAL